jgi:hypothetical protein
MSLHTLCKLKIHWVRNGPRGSTREGFDSADTLQEAFAIAEARVRGGGIPASAAVYLADDNNTPVRNYMCDFDARVTYFDHNPELSEAA